MFCDQTKLSLHAGRGGNGSISFRREKSLARGGPNGGDGGKGGDIYFRVNTALNTLTHLDTYKQFTAEKGEQGHGQRKHGRNGQNLILEVPLGTIIRNLDFTIIADLSTPEKSLLIAKGGRGGYGNAHFTSSIRQAPRFAELGEEGENIEIQLELKLVADIGIIGLPSSGKSTLISVISNAKPKIAAYPFTTLRPNLGVVKISPKETYVVADIPGLIENAHLGKGLGIQFLKHVQRCSLLVHLIDPTQPGENPQKNFQIINQELEKFSKNLAKKTQIVVINKADLLNPEEANSILKELKKTIGRKKRFQLYPHTISAITTQGTGELRKYLYQSLSENKAHNHPNVLNSPNSHNSPTIYHPHLDNPKYFSVEKLKKGHFQVIGQRIEQIVNMTDFSNREAVMRVHDVLKKMSINKELKKIGAKDGDTITIGKHEFELNLN